MSLFRRRATSDDRAIGEVPPVRHDSNGAPVDGYDSLKPDKIIASLRGYSQVDLAAIEDYERDNANRTVVLDKLRYLRTDEPVEGYDELSEDEIPDALEGADSATLARVREYERKFKRRDSVLTHIAGAGRNGHDSEAVADDG